MGLSSILVVCTGNVCRSPSAEGLLRRELATRFGTDAPAVASAGTMGWEGSPATEESVLATHELGVEIGAHRARMLTPDLIAEADLILTMAREHTARVVRAEPTAAARTFTLKELATLLEAAAPEGDPAERVAAAGAWRRAHGEPGGELDVEDPLGEPLAVYRAMAAELQGWSRRLVAGLAPARAPERAAR
jgi:protein-tyrosine-phosphatase